MAASLTAAALTAAALTAAALTAALLTAALLTAALLTAAVLTDGCADGRLRLTDTANFQSGSPVSEPASGRQA